VSFNPNQLHVVAVVHNPLRFASRERLFREFSWRMHKAGVRLHVVEAAFGDRLHVQHHPDHAQHVFLRQTDELWVKESMINVGVSRLPPDAEYVAWIDGDVAFQNPEWAIETIHQLQHYPVVQMFQTAIDLGPGGEALEIFNGFGYSHAVGLPRRYLSGGGYYGIKSGGKFWHPGFAWAIRRDVFDRLGGLIDWSILGSADHLMALAMVGRVDLGIPSGLHPNFGKHARIWAERAAEVVKGNLGYVPGTLNHHWHGRKRDRHYVDRWEVLKRHNYDPERDIRRDGQGLVALTHHGERMRRDLRLYFRSRNEDSVDLE